MIFNMSNFTVDKADFLPQYIRMLDENNETHELKFYVLEQPIKLEPQGVIPSFYMVNKYGEVYDQTQYLLVPYIRFAIADPEQTYTGKVDGVTYVNYRLNPFHPYWIGGFNYTGQVGTGTNDNPNKNAIKNLRQIMEPYLWTTSGINWWGNFTGHGISTQTSYWNKLTNIGENLVDNEGGIKQGMFMPPQARYLQASTNGKFEEMVDNHALRQLYSPSADSKSGIYDYFLGMSDISTNPTQPYILPPLFTDLISWFNNRTNATGNVYDRGNWCQNALSILTFGVQKV